jgi:hypothetical protein
MNIKSEGPRSYLACKAPEFDEFMEELPKNSSTMASIWQRLHIGTVVPDPMDLTEKYSSNPP